MNYKIEITEKCYYCDHGAGDCECKEDDFFSYTTKEEVQKNYNEKLCSLFCASSKSRDLTFLDFKHGKNGYIKLEEVDDREFYEDLNSLARGFAIYAILSDKNKDFFEKTEEVIFTEIYQFFREVLCYCDNEYSGEHDFLPMCCNLSYDHDFKREFLVYELNHCQSYDITEEVQHNFINKLVVKCIKEINNFKKEFFKIRELVRKLIFMNKLSKNDFEILEDFIYIDQFDGFQIFLLIGDCQTINDIELEEEFNYSHDDSSDSNEDK